MKASKETVQKVADLIKTYLKARFPLILEDAAPSDSGLTTIWMHIVDEHRSEDDSPRFANRKRVFTFCWEFQMYPDNTNDKTLLTLLRAAAKLVWTK